MLNLIHMADKIKKGAPTPGSVTPGASSAMADVPAEEVKEWEAFFAELEERLKNVPPEEIEAGAKKIEGFLKGEVGWSEVFNFTPEQMQQMAEMGYTHFKVGRYQDAERFFKVLTILDFDNYYYHSMMGSILQRQKRDGEAIVEYTQAIETNPNDFISLTNRGEIFMKHGWIKDATRDFEKVLSLHGAEENAWAHRAKTLLDQIKKKNG